MADDQAVGDLSATVTRLLHYCGDGNWAGYDPYDALNSRVWARVPFVNNTVCRIGFLQIMKRLPVNLRPLLLVPKEQNPKAIALFLTAIVKLARNGLPNAAELIGELFERLVALRSPNTEHWCWGYSFPWQTRTHLVPRWAPNIVCTTFVANALLDAYEHSHDPDHLDMAISAGEYLVRDLYWTEGDTAAGFSYPIPQIKTRVHNANFLGAALLCRIYRICGDERLLAAALKVARYSAAMQNEDGSWNYGELSTQRWIDNFHTGYNLCALRSIMRYAEISEFGANLRSGFEFYSRHFFREDGAVRYYHDRTYPIDIHSVAQSIITLLELKDLGEGSVGLARSVLQWALKEMWDERGYFYYQIRPYYKNRIPYMRWSQAWMLLALSTILEHCDLAGARTRKPALGESEQVA